VYGLLAPEIGRVFFPEVSKELQLINSFGVYLAAFLMRPLGAVMFGEIGDRMVGRKNALVFSIILITIPSILMGCLPTYYDWGWIAPVLLVILRLFQGLSVGGQLAGSYVLSIEQSSQRRRGLRGSICDASSVRCRFFFGWFSFALLLPVTKTVSNENICFVQSCGFLLASAVTTMTRSILTEDQVHAWGWRVPFLFSLLLAPALYFIITRSEESKRWAEHTELQDTDDMIQETEKSDRPAIVDLFSSPFRRRQLAGMIGVLSTTSSSFYTLFLWTPVYLSELRGIMKVQDADFMNFVVIGCFVIFLVCAGRLSDSFPHRMDLFRIGLPGVIVGAPVMFAMFESESALGYLVAQLMFAFCLALVDGGKAAWEVELWMADPTMSYTGVAIGHNVASTLFGGTLPLVATFLYYRSLQFEDGSDRLWPRMLPGLYVSVLGCVALYCVSSVVKHPHDIRTGGLKLKQLVEQENQRTELKKKKQKKKKYQELEHQLSCSTGGGYAPPTTGLS
jgi:MFS transporter, MHS family, proline/betaine transporter